MIFDFLVWLIDGALGGNKNAVFKSKCQNNTDVNSIFTCRCYTVL